MSIYFDRETELGFCSRCFEDVVEFKRWHGEDIMYDKTAMPKDLRELLIELFWEYANSNLMKRCLILFDGEYDQILCLDCLIEAVTTLAKETGELVFVERVGT